MYDLIVVGGGHAGVEAATAAARMGSSVALVTPSHRNLGATSCNPAVGGVGKSQLVRELDALDGVLARATDLAAIHVKVLNRSRGPAVRATRAQIDRARLADAVASLVRAQPGLRLVQAEVTDLRLDKGGAIAGVVLADGGALAARAVVLATGTFLGGVLHTGDETSSGGRHGDRASIALASRLRELGLPVRRLKTGTPPRLRADSLDYSRMEPQPGDSPTPAMSFCNLLLRNPPRLPQRDCHITRTNAATHEIVRRWLDHSPMRTGAIQGSGPRYCPSLEDKVDRFAQRDSHQIFIEPEGLDSPVVYPNGISTSLPRRAQDELVRSIQGFEKAEILRHGYAIEYDCFDPRALAPGLAVAQIPGLFLAGQINGTTGYEEAAAQGLVAGANAARFVQGGEAWVPARDSSYIGVMLDDLALQGAPEPYRMFTSRSEHRLLLREDNADLRLTPEGVRLGLVGARRQRLHEDRLRELERQRESLASRTLPAPLRARLDERGVAHGFAVKALDLLRAPDMSHGQLCDLLGLPEPDDFCCWDGGLTLQAEQLYQGYERRHAAERRRLQKMMGAALPPDLDYAAVQGLSTEARQRLAQARPRNLEQAARLTGVTAASLAALGAWLQARKPSQSAAARQA